MQQDTQDYIKRTIEIATGAVKNGNHPFGALLVYNGNILLESENAVVTEKDATQHAELRLVSQAARVFGSDILRETTLYCSTEPCAMCTGAIYWSGVRSIVFGCSEGTLAKYAGPDFLIPCSILLQYAKEKVEVSGPHLESLAEEVHKDFWKTLT